jgi:hypothetical protein
MDDVFAQYIAKMKSEGMGGIVREGPNCVTVIADTMREVSEAFIHAPLGMPHPQVVSVRSGVVVLFWKDERTVEGPARGRGKVVKTGIEELKDEIEVKPRE